MRTEFEKLPFIENLVNRKGVEFGKYYGKDIYLEDGEPFEYLNGAWWMYQEQQYIINGLMEELRIWKNGFNHSVNTGQKLIGSIDDIMHQIQINKKG